MIDISWILTESVINVSTAFTRANIGDRNLHETSRFNHKKHIYISCQAKQEFFATKNQLNSESLEIKVEISKVIL